MIKVTPKFFSLTVLVAIVFVWSLVQYQWWVLASLTEFRLWYQNTGLLLWIAKSAFVAVGFFAFLFLVFFTIKYLLIYALKIFRNERFQKVYINSIFFILMVICGWYVKTEHPFCDFPMYNSFPNWSIVFMMEDMNGNQLPLSTFSNYSASDIPDLYFNFMNNAHEPYGRLESNEWALKAGAEIGRKIKLKQELKGGFRLVRVYYHIKSYKIVEERTVLYERNI